MNTNRSVRTGIRMPEGDVRQIVDNGHRHALQVASSESSRRQPTAQAARSRAALDKIMAFYELQKAPRTNGELPGAPNLSAAGADSGAALRRQVSFLSLAPQLAELPALLATDYKKPGPRLDPGRRAVIAEVVKTAQVELAVVKSKAAADAIEGLRTLPMTLDTKRFGAFLEKQENAIAGVIDACENTGGRASTLEALIEKMVTDYLKQQDRYPSGLTAGRRMLVDEHVIDWAPVTVLVGKTVENIAQHFTDDTNNTEKFVLSLGDRVVYGAPEYFPALLQGVEDRREAEQRAFAMLQTVFHQITNMEEMSAAKGFRAKTPDERKEATGTAAELTYEGSSALGDACTAEPGVPIQRNLAIQPLTHLPTVARQYEQKHGEPLFDDKALSDWVSSPGFQRDVSSILIPRGRLPNAQFQSTAELLLQTKAFGGSGIARTV
ncbi:MAG: hypothetical protein H7327_15540 [Herminiimonas sp.]|nr:hypothetical protein [Herminiimonas sp.]